MPKASQFINATRTIKIPLTFEEENGDRKSEVFAVVYRAFSPKVAEEMSAIESGEGANMARSLARMLVKIPEIINEDGSPVEMNEENLAQFSGENLKALYEGVTQDINPTPTPVPLPDSPVISEPATTAAAN